MLSDSIFTIHRVEIPVTQLNQPIYLIPFGDVHRFSRLCDVEKWLEFLEWAKRKKNAHYLGMGDYDDLVSLSERKALNEAMLHEETQYTLEEIYTVRTKKLLSEISFMNGKLIGLLEGNHHGRFSSGMTTTQMMCNELGCKYLGVSSFIRLSFAYGSKRASIDIWAHHGKGASRLVGGSLNAVQQMAEIAQADVYLMGHDHKKSIATKTILSLDHGAELQLSSKKIIMGRTGSFLKGYIPDMPSYIAQAQYAPTDLGTLKIEMTPKRSRKGGNDTFYIDLHGSV